MLRYYAVFIGVNDCAKSKDEQRIKEIILCPVLRDPFKFEYADDLLYKIALEIP